jgi:hypothetical protein
MNVFHLFLFLILAAWLIVDFLAVKKDIDAGLGEKKTIIDFWFAFPVAISKLVKHLVTKKA